jgi:hypothetical protein
LRGVSKDGRAALVLRDASLRDAPQDEGYCRGINFQTAHKGHCEEFLRPWIPVTIITVIARLDRAIQYAAASRLNTAAADYWITRFRG